MADFDSFRTPVSPSDRAGLLDENPSQLELQSRPEWQLAYRVAGSKGFSKSELLPRFLLYICEQYLTGRTHEITEQRIGIQIFNRPDDYNPGEDNIVRSYARLLRKRLDQYFEGEGRDEDLRITIPRGGYIPVFQSNREVREAVLEAHGSLGIAVNEAPSAEIATTPSTAKDALIQVRRLPVFPLIFLGFLTGMVLAGSIWHFMQSKTDVGPTHAIWAQIFQQNRNTLIVATDSGLGIIENLSGHLVSVEEYANGSYLSDLKPPPGIDPQNFNDLRRQRYTSVVSLNITSMLNRLPEFIPNRTQVRIARAITAEDIKNSNVILLGSKHTNPWVALFEKRLNFKFEYTPEVDQSYVVNEHPVGAEQKVYENAADSTANHTYGAIAFLPGLDGAGHVLIIQGLNMAATQAAADTLFNAKQMRPILQQAMSNGTLKPFELLVETTSVGATAPGAQIIAARFDPQ